MSAHISMVTLGVDDLSSMTRFYAALGYKKSEKNSNDNVSFFDAGGTVLGLYGREALSEDVTADVGRQGNGAVTIAQNFPNEEAVDAFLDLAEKNGARIVKPAQKVFWGGYSGYFADPEGHIWEVAHNPFWELSENGTVLLEL